MMTGRLGVFFALTRRHFLVFFKNKIRVFYTLMVPLILFAVYVLFLRGLELSAVENTLLNLGIRPDPFLEEKLRGIVDAWMLSGIVALSTISVSIQTNNIIVNDKQSGVNRDLVSSPVPKSCLIGSYFAFNFIVTWIICFVVLLVCLGYLGVIGEFSMTLADVLCAVGMLSYATVSATLTTVFVCSFISSEATMASVVAVFSAAAGFLIGAYMPISLLPEWAQNLCAFFPGTYACSLFRYAFLSTPLQEISEYILQVLQPENGAQMIAELTGEFGFSLRWFQIELSPGVQAIVLGGTDVALIGLNLLFSGKIASVSGTEKRRKE